MVFDWDSEGKEACMKKSKYVDRLRANLNVVVIDPDLTDLFPNADAVNAALRSLSEIAKRARSEPYG